MTNKITNDTMGSINQGLLSEPMEAHKKTKLKIGCVCLCMMGHFLPIENVASALSEAGHEVYIITNGSDAIKKKTANFEQKYGIQMIYTDCGLTQELIYEVPKRGDPHALQGFMTKWLPYVRDTLVQLQADIIVCDFLSVPGQIVADEIGTECVNIMPGSMRNIIYMGILYVPDMAEAQNCCGLIYWQRSLKGAIQNTMAPRKVPIVFKTLSKSAYEKIWICTSYVGLEKAVCAPPNFKLVGSIGVPPGELMSLLKEKDIKLFEWLEESQAKNIPVVYITLGSMIPYEKWCVNTLYNGLEKLGCRIVWSLNDKWRPLFDKDPDQNPNFWIRGWLPQIELLHHPAVKCGLTHCGWGGLTEFVGAGKPVAAFPHFGDQFDNCVLIIEKKIGLELGKYKTMAPQLAPLAVMNPVFNVAKVEQTFKRLLNEQSFTNNIKKLQAIGERCEGRKDLVKIVESVYQVGGDHLLDKNLKKKADGMSFCCGKLFILFIFALFVSWIVYFIMEYFVETEN